MVADPSQADLAALFGAFNEVTVRLQRTHEQLTSEVVRLQGELRRANDELERSRRLAALGEMAAGIAHEVRNPLGSIGLYAEMLLADLGGREGERALAGKILSAVRGLDAVVGDVLAFSREMRVDPEPVEASGLIGRAVDSCADVLSGVSVVIAADHFIECDASMIHQALVNLVRNGAEAMGGSGVLRVSSRRVAPSGDDACGWIAVAVADTGPGVNDEVMDRMFNPFFTTRAAGTGLGLAIVHRIVDAHGGRVRVENRAPGLGDPGGATVEFLLPDRGCGGGSPPSSRSAA
jgi:signal transduction histidine kinase